MSEGKLRLELIQGGLVGGGNYKNLQNQSSLQVVKDGLVPLGETVIEVIPYLDNASLQEIQNSFRAMLKDLHFRNDWKK